MRLDKVLEGRNEVWVKSEKGHFVSTIDEVGDSTLTIMGPTEPELRLQVKPDVQFLITGVTERGLYMFEAVVKNVYFWNNVMQVELNAISDYKKIQRREAFRVMESIEVQVCKLAQVDDQPPNWVKTETVNISETGMLIRFNEECALGQSFEIEVNINLYGMNEILPKIHGRVVRCYPVESRTFNYLVGIEFEDLPDNVRNSIIKLVVLSQRNNIIYHHTKRY